MRWTARHGKSVVLATVVVWTATVSEALSVSVMVSRSGGASSPVTVTTTGTLSAVHSVSSAGGDVSRRDRVSSGVLRVGTGGQELLYPRREAYIRVPFVLAQVASPLLSPLAHVYFDWSEKGPGQNALRFLFAGEGDVPPLTHEILRRAVPDPDKRPVVHVGG